MRTPRWQRVRWFFVRLLGGEAMIFRIGATYRAYVAVSNTTSIGDAGTPQEAFSKALRYAGYRSK